MNKAELTAVIAKRGCITLSEASKQLDNVVEAIVSTLADGETVTIGGFGIFTPKSFDERMGRNPKTGAPAPIPARKTASFKLSKGLKDRLNEK